MLGEGKLREGPKIERFNDQHNHGRRLLTRLQSMLLSGPGKGLFTVGLNVQNGNV